MTIGDFLAQSTKTLQESGIHTARLDCLILLEDSIGKERAYLLAHPDIQLTPQHYSLLKKQLNQRREHTPLAYIRSKAMFYGRSFHITPAVLVPRPETEAIISLLADCSLPARPRIADIGTGSGCIGITAALELPGSDVDLYDISPQALNIARTNAQTLQAPVTLQQNDLLANVHISYNVILANIPYVPEAYPINKAAGHEPGIALFSGADGLDAYRTFWIQIAALEKPQYIITESMPAQHHSMAIMARSSGFVLEKTDGFAQLFSL